MKRLLLIGVFCLFWTQVSAQTLYVPSEEYSSIQSAIDDANSGDVIIVSAGTYQENINFLGNAITLRSVDPNDPNVVAETIIDGSAPTDSNFGSVVIFNSGEDTNSVLSGFTITGGTGSWVPIAWEFHEIYWNRCGGGVVCYNMSAPTISKNVFTGNIAGQGGGVYVYGDPVDPNDPSNPSMHVSPVIAENTFVGNTASGAHGFPPPDSNYPRGDHGDGGAIVGFQGVDAIIEGNLIQNNHADYYGGGIHLRQWSNGEIFNNQILNNDSTLGAGIHVTYISSPLIAENLIKSNSCTGSGGGGIYVYYYSDPVIERNFIAHNYSWYSAGIGVYWSSEPQIRDNILVKNNGLAILCGTDGTTIVTGNTISDNYENFSSGGIRCRSSASPIIEHNIITSNESGFGIYADTEAAPTIMYNNVWNNEKGNYDSVVGNRTGINGNISIAPNFVAADNNDYHLSCNSKCINAGDPNFAPAPNETDYDGNLRLLGQYVDIGADEVQLVWNITNNNQYETIQQAVDDANNYDIIVLTLGTYTGPGNKDIDFGGKALTLQSIDPNDTGVVAATVIDCQESGRGFRFHSGEDTNSILDGLTITNSGSVFEGGAIHCDYGSSPTVRNCIITNNAANGHGGGIYCGNDSNMIVTNCVISSNVCVPTGYGAGIYCYLSSPTITNCTITNNSAFGRAHHGGGICCWGNQYVGGNAIVANCIVSGNSAGQRGGGLYAYWSDPIFINCTIIGNRAAEGGGIGSFRKSNPQVINCIIRDNIAPDGNQLALINTLRVWPAEVITEMTISHCNVEGGQTQVCVDPNMILHWGGGNIDIDPNFVDSGYWDDANTPGDPNDDFFVLGNYHIQPSSPCVDTGDSSSVPSVSETDIDGEQRIFNDIVDIGADEMVKNFADFNIDGIVDYLDFKVMSDEWLSSGGQLKSDLFEDDFINFADYAELTTEWLWTAEWYE